MSRKRITLGFVFAALMLLFVSVKPAVAQNDYGGDDVDYQEFYDELQPYGQWVDDPDYGYVWVPDAGDDFRPYSSNGYWAYTDYGNTWVSNYNWGWAPFHYGRWTYNNYYGWMWIPGNTWGPAWVSWRSGGGNYGWAPLGPGVSVNIAIGGYSCPNYWWNFAPQQYIFDRGWNRYAYGPSYNNNYINQTTIINNTYIVNRNTYLGGPRRDDLRRATGRDPRPLAINNVRGPQRAQVRGDRMNIYRPAVATNRPDANNRPRQFRPAERPIRGNTPTNASGFGSNADTRPGRLNSNGNGRPGSTQVRDRNNAVTAPDRPVVRPDNGSFGRDGAGNQGLDRGRPIDRNPAQVNPDRNDPGNRPGQFQPQRGGSRFDDSRTQQQQQPQPQRNFDQGQPQGSDPRSRPGSFSRPQDAPQRGFERPQPAASPRFEQPRQQMQQPQRSFEQPRPQMQQQPQRSFDQPRPQMQQPQRSFEQPRPQMQQPRAMPQSGGGGGARPSMDRPGAGRR